MKYPNTFKPLKIRNLTIKNRIGIAPLCYPRLEGGVCFNEEYIAFIEAIAAGGTGLVTLGEVTVGTKTLKSEYALAEIEEPRLWPALCKMSEAVHRHGGAVSIELNNLGCHQMPVQIGGRNPKGPTAYIRKDGVHVEAYTPEELDEMAGLWANTARILKDCGFDMVMLHMGHGWLLHQFLSPSFNKRTDEFGGSAENRCRFPLMVVDRIRAAVGEDFPIDIRVSGSEIYEGGYGIETAIENAAILAKKVDMISVSCGGYYPDSKNEMPKARMSPSIFYERGVNVYLAEAIKKVVDIPVTAVGGLGDPQQNEEIIASGKADMVYMGRALVADHDFANKAYQGRDEDIYRCLRCHGCHQTLLRTPAKAFRCAVNPRVGHEHRYPHAGETLKAPTGKKVLVAGGGIAGMQAAITAANEGHSVVLYEKSEKLGGILGFSDHMKFKYDIAIFRDRMIAKINKHPNITIKLSTELTPGIIREAAPDAVFAAVGSSPVMPPISGIDKKHVFSAQESYGKENQFGDTVVVVGGGLVGVETAMHLSQMGKQVTILEMGPAYAPDATSSLREVLDYMLPEHAELRLGTKCLEILEDSVVAECNGEKSVIPADTVVIAAGSKSESDKAWSLYCTDAMFRPIGDCNKVGKIMSAVADGFNAAMDI